jgi:hypothetical protein
VAEIDIEIALEPDALEMTFDLGGSAPQPAPEPSGGCFIAGNVVPQLNGHIMYRGDIISGTANIEEE